MPYEVAAGSPGPFERNTPSNPPSRTSSAGVPAGKTSVSQPPSASIRRMLRLIPKSYAATLNSRPSIALAGPTTERASYGSSVDAAAARSAPSIPGRARTFANRIPASRSMVEIPARIAPPSRIRSVSRRVSMPSIPTTPASSRKSCRVPVARHDDALRLASRTANPATRTRPDSRSSALTP